MGSRMYSRQSSRRSSRSGSEEYMNVEIGFVDSAQGQLPWSFTVKLKDGSTIHCQLQGAQELPVSHFFLKLAADLDGHLEMAIVGNYRKVRLVQMLVPVGDQKRDMATLLKECNERNCYFKLPKRDSPPTLPSAILPHHDKFFKSIEDDQRLRNQKEQTRFDYNDHSSEYASPGNEPENWSISSHNESRYSSVKGYNTAVPATSQVRSKMVGLPEMRSDSKLKGGNRRRYPSPVGSDNAFSHFTESLDMMSDSNRNSANWENNKASACSSTSTRSMSTPSPMVMASFAQQDLSQLIGVTFRGCISHVDDPGNFYIVPEQFMHSNFQQSLQSKYLAKPKGSLPLKWQDTAFAVEMNGKWQRALVTSNLSNDNAEVFLVDSGWKGKVVSNWCIKLLDLEDAEMPPKAICCALRGVHRLEWSKEETDQLKGLGGVVEITLVSQLGPLKFSAIIAKASGMIINVALGSPGLSELKRRKSQIEDFPLAETQLYEAKVVGPWGRKIFLQLRERNGDLDNLEGQLRCIGGTEANFQPEVGQAVLVFEVSNLRRAVVTHTNFSLATCFFIDHGISKTIPIDCIQSLPEHFMVEPAFAVPCILAERETTSWPRQPLYLQVRVTEVRSGRPVVSLYRPMAPPIALQKVIPIERVHKPPLAASFSSGPISGPPSPRMIKPEPLKSPVKVPEGAQVATVTFVQSPTLVYVRLASKDAHLANLQSKIDQESLRPLEGPLVQGQVCLAFSKGRWMRAEVLPGGKGLALFFDFGHRGSLEKVCTLPDHLRDSEPAALLCLSSAEVGNLVEGTRVLVQIATGANRVVGLSPEIQESEMAPVEAPVVKKIVSIGCFEKPSTVWLLEDPQAFQDVQDRLLSEERSMQIISNPKYDEIYSVLIDRVWYRAKVVNLNPLRYFLLDLGLVNEGLVQQVALLGGLLKMIKPMAKKHVLTEMDISEKCSDKLKYILTSGSNVRAHFQGEKLLGLFVDEQNALEAAGYLVKVHVTQREEDGSVWLTRKSKAERRTINLQPVAADLAPLPTARIGARCVARNLADNLWYRAEITGNTCHFHIVRFVDFGQLGEAVELRVWWDKPPEYDARRYQRLRKAVKVDQELLTPKNKWSSPDAAPLFDLDMSRVD